MFAVGTTSTIPAQKQFISTLEAGNQQVRRFADFSLTSYEFRSPLKEFSNFVHLILLLESEVSDNSNSSLIHVIDLHTLYSSMNFWHDGRLHHT